jgi:hypothetical protein
MSESNISISRYTYIGCVISESYGIFILDFRTLP